MPENKSIFELDSNTQEFINIWKYLFWVSTFIFYYCIDIILTYYIISNSIGFEGNILAVKSIAIFGLGFGLVIHKTIFTGLLYLVYRYYINPFDIIFPMLGTVSGIYLFYNHLTVIGFL